MLIYLSYAAVAAIVVFLSNKAATYVDLLDKKTSLSGAFIGGVLLSAVTSLPELLTSISATVWLDTPGLCMGNILGSDLFNLAVLAVLIMTSAKRYEKAYVAGSHTITTLFLILIYGVIFLNKMNILNFEILTVNICSIIIVVLYGIALKFMAGDSNEDISVNNEVAIELEEEESGLTLKQIIIRFVLTSIGLVLFSILITYITDEISVRLNLGTGIAGALFLGIATSLPEVTSTISLIKMGNFNVAVGNIVGSNIFNFLVLAIADILYTKGSIFTFADPKTVNLLVFGAIATGITVATLKVKKKSVTVGTSIGIIACYIAFLAI